MKISFIGYGAMAQAIAHKLSQQQEYSLSASAPSLSAGINSKKIHTYQDNKKAIKDAEIIFLAVKPQQMKAVLNEIKTAIPPNCLIISIATGLDLGWLSEQCPAKQAIIRTMPNTPAQIGLGATPMIANKYVSEGQKQQAASIFEQIGITTWVKKEQDIDIFTALSGSGPAYVFLFLESLIKAAVELGLEETVAREFALQTAAGSIQLAQTSQFSLAQLRAQVTSPGGTTAAAVAILHNHLEALILAAMTAAKQRAQELGAQQ